MTRELVQRRELYVPRDLVFDAWTDERQLSGWYLDADCTVQQLQVRATVGGTWSLAWTDRQGAAFAETGTFEALDRPAGLSCGLRLSGPAERTCDTRLTLGLVDLGGACRIELQHGGFPSEAWRDRYAALWSRRLDNLLDFFSVI